MNNDKKILQAMATTSMSVRIKLQIDKLLGSRSRSLALLK